MDVLLKKGWITATDQHSIEYLVQRGHTPRSPIPPGVDCDDATGDQSLAAAAVLLNSLNDAYRKAKIYVRRDPGESVVICLEAGVVAGLRVELDQASIVMLNQ